MDRNPIDMLFDEECTEPITLYGEDGQAVLFEQIALIPIEDNIYVILKPMEGMEGLAEDEALVFAIVEEDGEGVLDIVVDNDIVDAVFEEYYAALADEGID